MTVVDRKRVGVPVGVRQSEHRISKQTLDRLDGIELMRFKRERGEQNLCFSSRQPFFAAYPAVYPENPIGIEIIDIVGGGSSGHGRNVAVVSPVLSRVFLESC